MPSKHVVLECLVFGIDFIAELPASCSPTSPSPYILHFNVVAGKMFFDAESPFLYNT